YPNTAVASGSGFFGGNSSAGGYGSSNSFNNSFGGLGQCPNLGTGVGYGMQGGGYGYPVFGGYAAQVPANVTPPAGASAVPLPAAPASPAGGAANQTADNKPMVRVVANPLDNALIIQ